MDDLIKKIADRLDNGMVEGHVSLAEKARLDAIEKAGQKQSGGKGE